MTMTGVRSGALISRDEQHPVDGLPRPWTPSDADREAFDRLAQLTRRLLDVDTALVSVIDRDRQVFTGHAGLREDLAAHGSSDLGHSFCRFPVATGERLVVRDARHDALLRRSPAIEDHDVVAYAGVPLEVAEGAVLGTLSVFHATPRTWTSEEIALLEELALLAVSEIEHRLHDRGTERLIELAARLDEPVARLGDVVRTTAHLAEGPNGDPRLPRMADLARSQMSTVEAITRDLVRVAGTGARAAEPVALDVCGVLRAAGDLALSAARPDDLVLDLPDQPVLVQWQVTPMSRALTLLITTGLHHLAPGCRVVVRLRDQADAARVSVRLPGSVLPVGELLRVVGHFTGSHGEELATSVSAAAGVTTVQNEVATATSTRGSTTFEVRLPAAGAAAPPVTGRA